MIHRDVLDALYRISSVVGETDDPQRALETIIDEMMAVLPAASASIEFINPDTGMLEIAVARGMTLEQTQRVRLQPGQGITGWVALHGRPLIVNDVSQDPRYIPIRESIRSEIAAPMEENGSVIGVVNIDSEKRNAFSEDHLRILTLLAREASRAVGKIWLITKLKTQTAQLHGLVAAGSQLVATHDIQTILRTITDQALHIMDCRLCALFLYEHPSRSLTLAATAGARIDEEYRENLRLEDSALGTAITHRRQIEVPDVIRVEEHHFTRVARDEGLVSMLATPLIYEDEVIGVLNAYTDRTHRFSNDERRVLSALAGLGAISIKNARLYARVFDIEESLRRNERLTTLGLISAEIAHEIRNPLTVIKLLYEGLGLDFPETDIRRRDVAVIREKFDQLETIVSRVLQFGKSSERLHSRYDLRQILEDTIHLVRLKLQQSRISLETHCSDTPTNVEVSKGQIQQALLNLIINAIHAMPDGGRLTIKLERLPRSEGDIATVSIGDTGAGIPISIRQRIFESFLSIGTDGSGSGLGLGIVKRILRSHHGDIEVAETGPSGTTMRLWLPIAEAIAD